MKPELDSKSFGEILTELTKNNPVIAASILIILASPFIFQSDLKILPILVPVILVIGIIGNLISSEIKLPIGRSSIIFHDTDSTDSARKKLIANLAQADTIIFIDPGHDDLVKNLFDPAFEKRKKPWVHFSVIFPNQENIEQLAKRGIISTEQQTDWEQKKKNIQVYFESHQHLRAKAWECKEYQGSLTMVGYYFAQKKEAWIQFAPVLAEFPLMQSPLIEIKRNSVVYEQFKKAFEAIEAKSVSIAEWDLFGRNVDGCFKYSGVFNRARIKNETEDSKSLVHKSRDAWFPVVLIMLHDFTAGIHRSVIQLRTIYNATDSFGTFSNISGRVCTEDIPLDAPFTHAVGDAAEQASPIFRKHLAEHHEAPSQILDDCLPEHVWKRAAVRELDEELGLAVDMHRLDEERRFAFKARNIYFRIYSLKLTVDPAQNRTEFDIIAQRRPHAALERFTFEELVRHWESDTLNRLLQNKFWEVFVPIFIKLQIEGVPKTRAELEAYKVRSKVAEKIKDESIDFDACLREAFKDDTPE